MAQPPWPPGLTDTDILIDAGRGLAEGIAFVTQFQSDGSLYISEISAMELIIGCANSADLRVTEAFLSGATLLPVTEEISGQAFEWMLSYRLSHNLLIPDALIAATANALNIPLYTKNTKHFQMLPGIQVVRTRALS